MLGVGYEKPMRVLRWLENLERRARPTADWP
jgi:hypothetical protein